MITIVEIKLLMLPSNRLLMTSRLATVGRANSRKHIRANVRYLVNVPPRSVEVIIENIPSRCAISAKLGTHDYKIGINKYPGNAGEIN
jgi:hypothetical protein